MIIPVKTQSGGYNVVIEKGALKKANEYFNLSRKVLVITDDGVPKEYARTVADMADEGLVLVIPQGEKSKNIENYNKILETLVGADFTRTDCIVAVGGGVVGDLSGFVAATYMRGIDFFNVPTTVLSQVDSSVGGKTAIDFAGYKNIVGAFYPPRCVLIDTDTLKTLPDRQISNGLCEAVKMSATCDGELFTLFESKNPTENLEEIFIRSINIKKGVVEADEKEKGLRRVLNFGHTLGHAIEANSPSLLHGECVGIGMLYMCAPDVKKRIKAVLEKLNLPISAQPPYEKIEKALFYDKKASGDKITTVYVNKIGSFEFKNEDIQVFSDRIKEEWDK